MESTIFLNLQKKDKISGQYLQWGAASQDEVEEFIDDTMWRALLSPNLDATKRIEILTNVLCI